MSRTKRRRRREQRDNRQSRPAMMQVDGIARVAAEHGMRLRISFITGPRTASPHWQFRDGQTEERLLDYWPSTGRWWSARTGERGFTADPWVVLELASKTVRCRVG
jgi:hypothetical protein